MKPFLGIALFLVLLLLTSNSKADSPYQQSARNFITELVSKYEVIDSFPYYSKGFIARHKPVWHYGIQVKVKPYRCQIYFFEYKDSLSADEAFASILQNFPNYGGPITRCKDIRGLKSPPVFYLVGYNSITILQQMCEEDLDRMIKFRERFLQAMHFKIYYNLTIGCGGPVTWSCP